MTFTPTTFVVSGQRWGGPCTLRAAITAANENIATAGQNIIIKLAAGVYNLTIPPVSANSDNHSGDLNIEAFNPLNMNSITIEPLGGGPVVIKSTIEDRILSVGLDAKVIIKNITMRDGQAFITTDVDRGGGAIQNRGTLDLDGVSLLNNIVRCSTSGSCTSTYISGGAIYNSGTLAITNSTLDGNMAARGSAIFNTFEATPDNLTIAYSTISNNRNSGQATIINYAELTILNSTFSGNSSESTSETVTSGIYNWGTLRMQSSTMANEGWNSGILNIGADSVANIQDNIFKAEPGRTNCWGTDGTNWNSWGYNIANDDSCELTAVGDLSSVDPLLGSFDYWGGPTKTYMLYPGSPAINHRLGDCQLAVNPIPDDQRHWPRNDGQCDTGAYEYSPWYLYLPLITK